MLPLPKPLRNGNIYTFVTLPMNNAEGKAIIYTVKETAMAGYDTSYQNIAPYGTITDCAYNGATITNTKHEEVVEQFTSLMVKKVWTGVKPEDVLPEISLLLYCNGEVYATVTPKPTADGWYIYNNLPAMVNGVPAVYSVVEVAVDGYMTVYTNNGAYADEVDCAYNGGTITNSKIPQTGDYSHTSLWSMMLVLVFGGWIALRALGRKWGVL